MKQNRKLLAGIFIGFLLAGIPAFFLMPLWVKHASFTMGFIAFLFLVFFILLALFISYKYSPSAEMPFHQSATQNAGKAVNSTAVQRIWLPALIVVAGVLGSFMLFNHAEKIKAETEYRRLQLIRQAELIESARMSGLVNLMSNVLDKIDDELLLNPNRTLSDETISRIATLSYAFKSYAQPESDSETSKKLSPERGHLLLELSGMNIDSGSLRKIMSRASFAGADLMDADLQGAQLSGSDLREANLQGANLEEAKLNDANLKSANLWGANLSKAVLNGADLKTADLRWTDMNGVDLQAADLHGADMTAAQMRKADMSGADLHFADLSGAFLQEANVNGANLTSTNMKRAQLERSTFMNANLTSSHLNEANLTGANLTGVNLTGANLTQTNLTEAELSGVVVSDKNWLIQLAKWGVVGVKEIQRLYKLTDHSSSQQAKYLMEKTSQ